MVTYIIASKATMPFLPECQMLGEFLEENCPDVTVKVVIKSNDDWGEFLDSVSNHLLPHPLFVTVKDQQRTYMSNTFL